MYKKQMIVQRVLCMAAIIISAVIFLYSLGIMTDLYDSLYSTMSNPNDLTDTDVPGSQIYYDMQPFNRTFLILSIGLILLAVLLFITNTHIRRRYYIGNYLATLAYAAGSVLLSLYAHTNIEMYKAQFLQIDFEALQFHAELFETLYTESTFWFDIHYILFGLVLLVSALLVLNLLWKTWLMHHEKKLILKGGAVA